MASVKNLTHISLSPSIAAHVLTEDELVELLGVSLLALSVVGIGVMAAVLVVRQLYSTQQQQ